MRKAETFKVLLIAAILMNAPCILEAAPVTYEKAVRDHKISQGYSMKSPVKLKAISPELKTDRAKRKAAAEFKAMPSNLKAGKGKQKADFANLKAIFSNLKAIRGELKSNPAELDKFRENPMDNVFVTKFASPSIIFPFVL